MTGVGLPVRSPPENARRGLVLARQRQERILEEVRVRGGARVSDLVDLLGVSDMTVRRDIAALARRGLVARVHGGATAVTGRSADEPGFEAKFALQTTQKEAIARAAAALVGPGASVAVSAGTTTYAVALELREIPDLTVVTNSIPVADLLHSQRRDDLTVMLTGGARTPSDALVGPVAVAALRSAARRLALPRGARHRRARRAHHAQPGRGGDQPRAHRRRPAGRGRRRTPKWGVVGLSSMAPTRRGRHPRHRRRPGRRRRPRRPPRSGA